MAVCKKSTVFCVFSHNNLLIIDVTDTLLSHYSHTSKKWKNMVLPQGAQMGRVPFLVFKFRHNNLINIDVTDTSLFSLLAYIKTAKNIVLPQGAQMGTGQGGQKTNCPPPPFHFSRPTWKKSCPHLKKGLSQWGLTPIKICWYLQKMGKINIKNLFNNY